jgi:membrane dipeptidase
MEKRHPLTINRRKFIGLAAGAAVAPASVRSLPVADAGSENDKIAADRRAAMDILKPSSRELDRARELHAHSVVLDTYGFGPAAAVDNEVLAKLVKSGASEWEIKDARGDMAMTRFVTDPAERAEYESAWEAAGVTCIVRNAGEEGNNPLQLMKRLARWIYVTDHLRANFPKAVKADDIVAAKKAGHRAIMLTTNGVPLVQQWLNMRDELRFIRVFAEMGVRMMHVTYNRQNPLGTGCGEAFDGGLTDFGRLAVAELNRQGVLADVAHSSQKTSFDTAKVSTRPMIASHSGAAAINPHIRCKQDEVIRAIADTGGLIGICCINGFLGRGNDINAFLDHIDYVAKKFGVDHVGIGTDVGYSSRLRPGDVRLPARPPTRARWEGLWPPGSRGAGTRDPRAIASLAWTNWPMFTVGLVQRGYRDADIQKILGDNMLRVMRASES